MNYQVNVEERVVAALEARGAHAASEPELKALSGVEGTSFKEALIRLLRKEVIIKWKNDLQANHIVLTKHADEAYYLESVALHQLSIMFGGCQRVTIQRTIPFLTLPQLGEKYRPRRTYRDGVALIAYTEDCVE
jgi:hypothetical protein